MKQKGIALITTVLVCAIMLVVVGGIIVVGKTEISTTKNNERAAQAFSLAEAGIDWAEAKIREAQGFTITSTTLAFSNGTVRVQIQSGTNTATVTSVSLIGSADASMTPTAQRAIQACFLMQTAFNPSWAWHRAITADGKVTAFGNIDIGYAPSSTPSGASTQSNLVQSGSISFTGNIDVTGNPGVGYVPGGSANLVGNLGGTTTGQVAPDPVPDIPIDLWRSLAQTAPYTVYGSSTLSGNFGALGNLWRNGNLDISGNGSIKNIYVSGNLSMSGNVDFDMVDGSVVFAEGNITISGNFHGNATFVSAGSITMTGNVDISGLQGMAMIAQGDLTLTGNKDISGYIYSASDIRWNGNASLKGGIACKGELDFGGNVNIEYNGFGSSTTIPGLAQIKQNLTLLSWEEVPLQ